MKLTAAAVRAVRVVNEDSKVVHMGAQYRHVDIFFNTLAVLCEKDELWIMPRVLS